MNMQQGPREASPRALEGGIALSSSSRGRSAAPHFSLWLPLALKAAAAAGVALILAVIGTKAGAHGPRPSGDPAPSATPPVAAGAFMVGLTAAADATDASHSKNAPTLPMAADAGNPSEVGRAAGLAKADAEPGPAISPPGTETQALGEALLADGRVVLNLASEADLTRLPGIGPSRARAILALRQRLTKFRAVEDLLRVKGIGRKMLRRLRPSVVLDRPAVEVRAASTTVATRAPAAPDQAPLSKNSESADR